MGKGTNLRTVLLDWAEQDPAEPAIVSGEGRVVSRSDLTGLLMAAEEHLRQLGLQPQDWVAVLMPQGPDGAIVALLVACACSLAPLRPGLQPQQWPALLTRLAPAALVLPPGLASELASAAEALGLPLIEPCYLLRAEPAPKAMAGGTNAPDNVDQAVVIATSGSTVRPKLVNLQQAGVLRGCRAMVDSLQLTPVSSDSAFGPPVFAVA